ncbi:hypothetical protein HK104_001826 [Borealophlyctis nickersoniae]|nr:hypothetical protein HK104_001826 [Borealophlyctis nickersoniae]
MRQIAYMMLWIAGVGAAWPYGNFTYTVPFAKGGGSASIAELQASFIGMPPTKLLYNAVNYGATAWGNMKTDPKDGSVVTFVNLPHIYIQPYVPSVQANYTPDDIAIAYIHSYTPLVLFVAQTSPIQTWDDFVQACKTSDMTVSGAGSGTIFELATWRLQKLSRQKMRYVPADVGALDVVNDILKGKVMAAFTTTPVILNRKDIRVIAIASEFEFPQIIGPTFKTLGINFVDGIYRCVGLPAGTPENVLKDVSDYFNALNRNLTYIAAVQPTGAVQVFMDYGSKSLQQFTSTYRTLVHNTLFPPEPISQGTLYAMFVLGSLGLLLTFAAAIFAGVYRATPVIKSSSYFFNNIILIGIALAYLSVIVMSIQMPLPGVTEKTLSRVCQAIPWLLGLGFDIAFSALIVKSYRLYRIFLFSVASVIQFDASNLAVLRWVVGICGINSLLYLVWTAQDPMTATLTTLDDTIFYYSCESDNTPIYLGISLAFKYVMLISCIFFSVKLRDLNAAMNESKAIAAATISTTFVLTICLAVYPMVSSFQGRYIILAGGIFVGTTSCLAALFGPKVMVVLLAPNTNSEEYLRRLMQGNDDDSADMSSVMEKMPGPGTQTGTVGTISRAAPATGQKNPIYVTEGKGLARDQRDKLNALVRVVSSTAASGRFADFQRHVDVLSKFAARLQVAKPATSSSRQNEPGSQILTRGAKDSRAV